MTTLEQKALAACVEYARLNKEIKALGNKIGDALSACPGTFEHNFERERIAGVEYATSTETHLTIYYGHANTARAVGYTGEVKGEKEMLECPHCFAAHNAIQARKALRVRLAAVKRQFTMLGRSA